MGWGIAERFGAYLARLGRFSSSNVEVPWGACACLCARPVRLTLANLDRMCRDDTFY